MDWINLQFNTYLKTMLSYTLRVLFTKDSELKPWLILKINFFQVFSATALRVVVPPHPNPAANMVEVVLAHNSRPIFYGPPACFLYNCKSILNWETPYVNTIEVETIFDFPFKTFANTFFRIFTITQHSMNRTIYFIKSLLTTNEY